MKCVTASKISLSAHAAADRHKTRSLVVQFEGCPFCRRVREVITYLDLCVTIKPCAQGSRHREEVVALSGKSTPTFPYLVDQTAEVSMFESEDICAHLLSRYGGPDVEPLAPPPLPLLALPSLFRWGRGTAVEESARNRAPPAQPLTLYSYEGNQFCRLVREVLCECDLPYELRSTGKGSPRREELQERSGKTTAPYLVDANTGTSMPESADIVAYLAEQYGGS